jgi:hypothetical protein
MKPHPKCQAPHPPRVAIEVGRRGRGYDITCPVCERVEDALTREEAREMARTTRRNLYAVQGRT